MSKNPKPDYEVFRHGYIFDYDSHKTVPHWHWRLRVGSWNVLIEDGFYSSKEAVEHCKVVQLHLRNSSRKIVVRKRALRDV